MGNELTVKKTIASPKIMSKLSPI